MQLGLIGLGKMGGNMRERLRQAGHEVVGYDRNPDVSDVTSLEALVEALDAPRTVWVMVPAGDPTRQTIEQLGGLLDEGDLVIDGGNSRFTDDFENAAVAVLVCLLDSGASNDLSSWPKALFTHPRLERRPPLPQLRHAPRVAVPREHHERRPRGQRGVYQRQVGVERRERFVYFFVCFLLLILLRRRRRRKRRGGVDGSGGGGGGFLCHPCQD